MIIYKEYTAFQLKTFGAITMFLDHAYKICFFWIVSGLSVWLHLGEEICYNIVTLLFGITSMSFFIFAFNLLNLLYPNFPNSGYKIVTTA